MYLYYPLENRRVVLWVRVYYPFNLTVEALLIHIFLDLHYFFKNWIYVSFSIQCVVEILVSLFNSMFKYIITRCWAENYLWLLIWNTHKQEMLAINWSLVCRKYQGWACTKQKEYWSITSKSTAPGKMAFTDKFDPHLFWFIHSENYPIPT